MNFDVLTLLLPNLFYSKVIDSKEYFLYPVRQLEPADDYHAVDYVMANDVHTNFTIQAVGQGTPPDSSADIVGFLFKSNLPVANHRTSIMSYARAWQQNTPKVDVGVDELTLALKDEHFLMYHVPGKATVVTTQTLSDHLHDYLTMI